MAYLTFPKFLKCTIWGICELSRNSHTPYGRGGNDTGKLFRAAKTEKSFSGATDLLGEAMSAMDVDNSIFNATPFGHQNWFPGCQRDTPRANG